MKHASQAPKKHRAGKLVIVLILLVILGFGAYFFLYQPVKEKAAAQLYDQAASSFPLDPSSESAYESLTDDQKETVQNIVMNHVDGEALSVYREYQESGDASVLKDYAMNELSQEEIDQLLAIYRDAQN